MLSRQTLPATAALSVSLGTWLFAYCIHNYPAISMTALFLSAVSIAYYINGFSELLSITGLQVYNRKVAVSCAIAISFGIALAFNLNWVNSVPLITFPLKITAFTVALVGITEELVFRGYIQGMLSRNALSIHRLISGKAPSNLNKFSGNSALIAIVGSAASHTIYKVVVLWSFPTNLGLNFYYLAFFTFTVGILAAWLRHTSRSILPTALGHGVFDVVVYGSMALPVWVFG